MAETETTTPLYDTDILLWSEQQAKLLRRRASNELDWDNLAEEINDVGLSQLHAVESLLVQALVHMLKVKAWPEARDVEHWRAEAIRFRGDPERRFSPSMRQRLDLAKLYRQAVRAVPAAIDAQPRPALPAACPMTLAELLSEETE
jgi:hypothetical protein